MVQIINNSVDLSIRVGETFEKFFPESESFIINDISGEDHIITFLNESRKPIFDSMITTARKFVFVWYYNLPDERGIEMIEAMKNMVINDSFDFAVKYAGVQQKSTGFPSIIRYGTKTAGHQHEKFVLKKGNIFLEDKRNIYDDENKQTYRIYEWGNDSVLDKIYKKSDEMLKIRLRNHPDYLNHVLGFYLYSGGAFSYVFPRLGFGLRDIDVEVLFDNKIKTNTRCAFTRNCDIEELGVPKYFNYKTRWLDLMFNNVHTEETETRKALKLYLDEMRAKSDRWSTMAQRPFINLLTHQIEYIPNWIISLYNSHKADELFTENNRIMLDKCNS